MGREACADEEVGIAGGVDEETRGDGAAAGLVLDDCVGGATGLGDGGIDETGVEEDADGGGVRDEGVEFKLQGGDVEEGVVGGVVAGAEASLAAGDKAVDDVLS